MSVPPRTRMFKGYEYTYIKFTYLTDAMNELLDKYTNDGWIVVNFTETTSTDIAMQGTKVWLKRKTYTQINTTLGDTQ